MCGFTLMNNQVGVIIADVLKTQPNVAVTYLPSMIRVDGGRRFDLVYADVDEAAGEEEGWFNAAEFEESMSTHYGRMIHEDDRTIMFANPEDAAEYLGFDLTVVPAPSAD
jgi:propane monooxygenase coupling protein